MFVLTWSAVPANFRLFELVGDEYCLNFLDAMSGRVALPTGIADLSVLRGQAKRTQQGVYQLKLTDDSRGKLVLGDVTFLFQFVAPPPVQPKPQLPVAVLRGATSIDWTTTMIAAFSFLLHFLAIGSLYSDWLDPVVNEEANLASLVDSVKSLPPPPPVEQTKQESTDAAADAKAEEKSKEQKTGGAGKKSADAEGLRVVERDNVEQALVSFEQTAAVRVFDGPDFARATPRGWRASEPPTKARRFPRGIVIPRWFGRFRLRPRP